MWTKLTLTSVSAKKVGKEKSAASVCTKLFQYNLSFIISYEITFPET